MDATELRAMQAPIKERYKYDRRAALITLKAKGSLDERTSPARSRPAARWRSPACIRRPAARAELCSGDMLLEALVACAGVTLKAVSTALAIPLKSGTCRPRAISTFAARSASTRRPRSGSPRSACASMSIPTRRRTSSTAAQAHRALLRGVPDHQERPAGSGIRCSGCEQYSLSSCPARRRAYSSASLCGGSDALTQIMKVVMGPAPSFASPGRVGKLPRIHLPC